MIHQKDTLRLPEISNSTFTIVINESLSGFRLDQVVAHRVPDFSRSVIGEAIKKSRILVDGLSKKNSYRVKAGECIKGSIEQGEEIDILPAKIDFPILMEDDHLLLISKPPGLVVHPGSGNPCGTLVNGLVYYYKKIAGVGDQLRPGIVHRLDKDTSGIMVVAKTEEAHRKLVKCFKDHQLKKEYLALLHGYPKNEADRIVLPIGRHPVVRQKMSVNEINGKHAVSSYQVKCAVGAKFSLATVTIETGRTHQIRVHMAHLGHPVAGDTVYGSGRDNRLFPRQMLHASRLAFKHPVTGDFIDIKADLWPDFKKVLESLNLNRGTEAHS